MVRHGPGLGRPEHVSCNTVFQTIPIFEDGAEVEGDPVQINFTGPSVSVATAAQVPTVTISAVSEICRLGARAG